MSAFAHLTDLQKQEALKRARIRVQELRAAGAEDLAKIELETQRRECETLKGFTKHFWHVLEPRQQLLWNWHLDELCDIGEQIYRGELTHVIGNVPPGTMKSLLMSVMFRAWVWSKNPSARFLSGSYSADLSVEHNVKLRDVVTSELFKKLFPTFSLRGDTKQRIDTTAEGWSIATSVGGVGTGEHPDYVLVDDPLTEQQSRSDTERKTANTWISRTLSSRGVIRGVRVLIIMQRLHDDDPSGHMMRKGGWHVVKFPMRYEGIVRRESGEVEYPDPRDQRTTVGQLLWPAAFPEERVKRLENDLGPFATAGQLQQRPVPEGGGLVKASQFRYVDVAPARMRVIRGWDTAATEDDGDYTVGVKIGEDLSAPGTFYVLHVVREQVEDPDALVEATAKQDGKKVEVRIEREPGSSGKAIGKMYSRSLKGFSFDMQQVSKDKPSRARAYFSQIRSGNVYLLRGDWNAKYVDELCSFPTGLKDDQVDGSSCAFNGLLIDAPKLTKATWGD